MEVDLQPAKSVSLWPDPCLTANLYCNRRLPPMARDVLGPLASDLAAAGTTAESFFWFTRYGKCGEHLKVRVHGDESIAAAARDSLEIHARRFFASPAADAGDEAWISKSAIPALDLEDELEGDYPNKTLLWTHYRRSPVVFGADVYLPDDVHVERFCRCQAAVTSIALGVLLPKLEDPAFAKHRQSTFLRILITAMSVLGLSPAETAGYLAYHRDWLIRSLTHDVAPQGTSNDTVLAEIRESAALTPAAVRPLTDHVANALAASKPSTEYCRDFHRELSAFYQHVSTYRGNDHFDRDPFTRDFAFLPIFKVLHFAANQLGFRISNEAFVFDLLCRATEPLCPKAGD
ncbi:MAG TPA: lantibiotic dehydratase C-terminal domain-containing protein [Thermoanaerobaculia bacterium]|jgi:hypothetical protein|nr:lantibiotic dehydratase C-terminal domain-containing protein [Thermoanaerobaculia bacterium]